MSVFSSANLRCFSEFSFAHRPLFLGGSSFSHLPERTKGVFRALIARLGCLFMSVFCFPLSSMQRCFPPPFWSGRLFYSRGSFSECVFYFILKHSLIYLLICCKSGMTHGLREVQVMRLEN